MFANDPARRTVHGVLLVLLLATLAGCVPHFPHVGAGSVDGLDALRPGDWTTVEMGGDTSNSDGTPYEIYVKPGTSDDLVVYFGGGGAAWDGETATHPATLVSYEWAQLTGGEPGYYLGTISPFEPFLLRGMLSAEDSDNPFHDWTFVYVPYTTGDLHVGDRVVDYVRDDGSVMTMRYHGYRNARAAIEWTHRMVPDPDKLFVVGQSAGGFGAAIWFDAIASRYPESELYQYSDSSYLVSENAPRVARDVWGARVEERYGFAVGADVTTSALRHVLETYGDRVTILQSETIGDRTLPKFEARLNGEPFTSAARDAWSERMRAALGRLEREHENVHLYLTDYGRDAEGWTAHTLSEDGGFHGTNEDGVPLARWLADAVIEDRPYSVGLEWLED